MGSASGFGGSSGGATNSYNYNQLSTSSSSTSASSSSSSSNHSMRHLYTITGDRSPLWNTLTHAQTITEYES